MDFIIKKMQYIEDKLDVLASLVAATTFAVMSVIVCTQVISRYFFSYSFQWAEEMGRYLFIWSTMLASACATHTHLHIGVDILVSNIKGKAQLAVKLTAQIFLIIAVYILTVYGAEQTMDVISAGQTATSFPVSAGVLYLSIPVSGALMLYYAVVQLLELICYGKYRDTAIHDFFREAGIK
jgi:TRAP-type C4-dicarboxylate transport system permease small subunit